MAILEFYKKGQGSLGRILAVGSLFGLMAWGGHALWVTLQGSPTLARALLTVPHLGLVINLALVISVGVTVGGVAFIVWVLNRPKMVDLLIETEGEMRKVSWPSKQEAWNSSVVVMVTVLFMMGLLFFYDYALNFILQLIFFPGGA